MRYLFEFNKFISSKDQSLTLFIKNYICTANLVSSNLAENSSNRFHQKTTIKIHLGWLCRCLYKMCTFRLISYIINRFTAPKASFCAYCTSILFKTTSVIFKRVYWRVFLLFRFERLLWTWPPTWLTMIVVSDYGGNPLLCWPYKRQRKHTLFTYLRMRAWFKWFFLWLCD